MILTSVEAKKRFGHLLDTAQREPITITRRGRPVAVLIAMQHYLALQQEKETVTVASTSGRNAIAAFRGSGGKATVSQLLADRSAELSAESNCFSTQATGKQPHA